MTRETRLDEEPGADNAGVSEGGSAGLLLPGDLAGYPAQHVRSFDNLDQVYRTRTKGDRERQQ